MLNGPKVSRGDGKKMEKCSCGWCSTLQYFAVLYSATPHPPPFPFQGRNGGGVGTWLGDARRQHCRNMYPCLLALAVWFNHNSNTHTQPFVPRNARRSMCIAPKGLFQALPLYEVSACCSRIFVGVPEPWALRGLQRAVHQHAWCDGKRQLVGLSTAAACSNERAPTPPA